MQKVLPAKQSKTQNLDELKVSLFPPEEENVEMIKQRIHERIDRRTTTSKLGQSIAKMLSQLKNEESVEDKLDLELYMADTYVPEIIHRAHAIITEEPRS